MEYLLFKEGEERKMGEMMNSTSTRSPSNQPSSSSPPWKLYENPLYTRPSPHQEPPNQPTYNDNLCQHWSSTPSSPLSDLTFFMEATAQSMRTELDEARARIMELKAELEFECRLRKKMECLASRMANELDEERRGRETAERVCEELGGRVSCHKAEIERMRREMEEERRMLRVAEVFREERVQMKLTDAKIFYEQKLLRLEQPPEEKPVKILEGVAGEWCVGEGKRWVLGESNENGGGGSIVSVMAENPHIKRGIKGSVEFQRVVRALCSNQSNRQGGGGGGGNFKLECQKAQLKILLKQRSPFRPNSLVIS